MNSPKKKKGKVIPSRYKQSACKKADESKSCNFSSERSFLMPSKSAPDVRNLKSSRKCDGFENTSSQKLNVTQLSTTPEAHGKGASASTPSSDKSVDGCDIVDLSAISSVASNSLRHSPVNKVLFKHSKQNKGDSIDSSQKNESFKTSVADRQQHLDILYAQYIQWVFMDSKLNKDFNDQENKASQQINDLWNECNTLEDKRQELSLKEIEMNHILEANELLSNRKAAINPLTETITPFYDKYSKMARALDTTCHRIPTTNIYFPDNSDDFHESLDQTVHESAKLMSDIKHVISDDSKKMNMLRQNMISMANTIESEVESLQKCQEVTSAIEMLTVSESSFRLSD